MRKLTSEKGRVRSQPLGQAGTQPGSPDAQCAPPPSQPSSDDRALPLSPAAPPCPARRPKGSGQRRAPAAAACQTLRPAPRRALPRPPGKEAPPSRRDWPLRGSLIEPVAGAAVRQVWAPPPPRDAAPQDAAAAAAAGAAAPVEARGAVRPASCSRGGKVRGGAAHDPGRGRAPGPRSEGRIPATLESRDLWNGAGAQRGRESLGAPGPCSRRDVGRAETLWRGTERACLCCVYR